MNSFFYEEGYYIIYAPLVTYYQRLWVSIYGQDSRLTNEDRIRLFNIFYETKKARHACLVCNAPPEDKGHIVISQDAPGTPKYICEEHYERFRVFEELRKL